MKIELEGHEVELTFDEEGYPTVEITLNGCLGDDNYPMADVVLNGVKIHEMIPEGYGDERWKS